MVYVVIIVGGLVLGILGGAAWNSPEGRNARERAAVEEMDRRLQSEFQAALAQGRGKRFRQIYQESAAGGCPAYKCVESCNDCNAPNCRCIQDPSCASVGRAFRCQPTKTQ